MKKTLFASAVVLLLAGILFAQMREGSLITLNNLYALPMSDEAVKAAGDAGFLIYYGQNRDVLYYQSFDGHETYKYNTRDVEAQLVNEYHNWSDYTGDGSSVYVLWNYNPVRHVVLAHCKVSRFDRDGAYRGTVELEGDYLACHKIAMAGKDELIVTTTATDDTPFVGLFQANGQLIKRIKLPNDLRMTADPKKKLGTLEYRDQTFLDLYEGASRLDSDGEGNVMLVRRFPAANPDDTPQPTVVFLISRSGEVSRFVLEKPRTKYGSTFVVRAFHGKFVVLGTERNDASEVAHCVMRVYDRNGKLLEDRKLPVQFGFMLLDWNEHRALFATQAGNPRAQVRHLGIIEAIPE